MRAVTCTRLSAFPKGIALSPDPNLDSRGLTTKTWKVNEVLKTETIDGLVYYIVKTSPEFSMKLFYNSSLMSDPFALDLTRTQSFNSSTGEHEQHHAQLYKENWNEFYQLGRVYEEVYFCDKGCGELAMEIIRTTGQKYFYKAEMEQVEFHNSIGQIDDLTREYPRFKTLFDSYSSELDSSIESFMALDCWNKTK